MSDLPAGSDIAPPAPLAGHGQETPVWAYVIGGASLVVAAQGLLGLLGSLVQVGAFSVLTGWRSTFLSWPNRGQTFLFIAEIIPTFFQPFMCGVLVPAAILLIRRKQLAVRLHMVYAIVAIVLAGTAPLLGIAFYVGQNLTKEVVAELILQETWTATRLAIYPIFVLVWFRRARIGRQTEQWGR
jgi:hypothetical protein